MKKLIISFFFALAFKSAIAGAQTPVLIIAHPGIKAQEISKADLSALFTGSLSTISGVRATPILLKQGPVTTDFLTAYVGKNDTAFILFWRSLVFSGQATMPRTLNSDAAVVDFVSTHPGTVGYIASSTPHDGVRVLPVR